MDEEIEVWKDVPNYYGMYQCSNLGRVKGLDRVISNRKGNYIKKGKILKNCLDGSKYEFISLNNNGVSRKIKVHQVIAITFLNHKINKHLCVIDHINGDRSNNKLNNLRIVSQRYNTSSCFRKDKINFTSKHAGVSWHIKSKKWMSKIYINKKQLYLGVFNTELEASKAYQDKLKEITLWQE